MTKVQRGMLNNYNRSEWTSLHQVYQNPSWSKQRAFDWCMELVRKYSGNRPRICTFNSFGFTFGFTFEMEGKTFLRYETPNNSYTFPIDE